MKADFLKPFIKSVSAVMENMVGEKPKTGTLYFRAPEDPFHRADVAIIVKVSGSVSGNVVMSMDLHSAKALATRILCQENVFFVFDEDANSALGEMANIITAGATIGLCEAGYPCDIDCPEVMYLPALDALRETSRNAIVIPLKLSFGDMELSLSLEETAVAIARAS